MIDQAIDAGIGADPSALREMEGMYLGLRWCGLSVEQAANLTARLEGIHAVPGGWSLRDVQRLRFMRWLVAAGRLGADDTMD